MRGPRRPGGARPIVESDRRTVDFKAKQKFSPKQTFSPNQTWRSGW
jgi:hypothetical protein